MVKDAPDSAITPAPVAARSAGEGPEYVNPLDSSPRWLLYARVSALRILADFGFSLGNYRGSVPSSSETIWLDSTLGEWRGRENIKVDVFIPSSAGKKNTDQSKRPAVINFHGGGFVLGQGKDDARWAGAVMEALDAVVFSVNYRLAPGYPFPTPIEDCVDAILQICGMAATKYDIDTNHIILCGFSAGGTAALSSWVVLQDPERWNYQFPESSKMPRLAGLVLFYPMLDTTLDRPQKRQRCKRPDLTLPPAITNAFDASYVFPPRPRRERNDPRLSPGLMPDEMVDELPPVHLCMCEYDMLLVEGQEFVERVKSRNKTIDARVVEGEQHGWDKNVLFRPKETVAVEYAKAIEAMKTWLGRV